MLSLMYALTENFTVAQSSFQYVVFDTPTHLPGSHFDLRPFSLVFPPQPSLIYQILSKLFIVFLTCSLYVKHTYSKHICNLVLGLVILCNRVDNI